MTQGRRAATEDPEVGRHPDVWAMVIISLIVGTLGVFNVVNQTVIASATLGALGLVAVTTIWGRIQIASLMASTAELVETTRLRADGAVSVEQPLSTSTSGADIDLDAAMDIRIVGVTLGRTLRNQCDMLERRLLRGAVVRVAVIAPVSRVLEEAARRTAIPDTSEVFDSRLRPTLHLLDRLARTPGPGRLEVRLLTFVPAVGIIAIDPGEPRGLIQVDIYSHRLTGREPTMVLRAGRDRQWYTHFLDEFDQIWSTGDPVPTQPCAEGKR